VKILTIFRALHHIGRLLQSKNNNCKYAALAALEVLMRNARPPDLTEAQEDGVLDCLTHHDDSIKRKTLALLCALANEGNVRTVCKKLVEYVRETRDLVHREVLVGRAVDLTDKFGSGSDRIDWYVSTLLKLLQNAAPGAQREEVMGKMKVRMMTEDREVSAPVVKKMLRVLKKLLTSGARNVTVARMYVWLVGEFPQHLEDEDSSAIVEICSVGLLEENFYNEKWHPVLRSCLNAIFTLVTTSDVACKDLNAFLQKCLEQVRSSNAISIRRSKNYKIVHSFKDLVLVCLGHCRRTSCHPPPLVRGPNCARGGGRPRQRRGLYPVLPGRNRGRRAGMRG
jgi:hypothetical protein